MRQRLGARIIDGFALFAILIVAVLPFVDLRSVEAGETPEFATGDQLAIQAIAMVLWALYTIPSVTRWGQTMGRFLVGIRVARIDDGGSPDLGQAAIRFLLPNTLALVPAVGPVLFFAVLIRAAFNPERRGWHDLAAGTVVLRQR